MIVCAVCHVPCAVCRVPCAVCRAGCADCCVLVYWGIGWLYRLYSSADVCSSRGAGHCALALQLVLLCWVLYWLAGYWLAGWLCILCIVQVSRLGLCIVQG